MKVNLRVLGLFIALSVTPIFSAQTVSELEQEIKQVRKKLVEVQNERADVTQKIKEDRKEFASYREKIVVKLRKTQEETDSLRKEASKFKKKRNRLGSNLLKVKNGQKAYELKQESYRKYLLSAVENTITTTETLSPSLREKPVAALALLKSELQSKGVDNVEAVARLFQVVRDLDGGSYSIQIVQGNSPVSEIRGSVYRLRIGTLLEAVVDLKGSRAAIWSGLDENGTDQWSMVDDIITIEEILKGVNVREGKALPSLVNLSFLNAPVMKMEGSNEN